MGRLGKNSLKEEGASLFSVVVAFSAVVLLLLLDFVVTVLQL